MFDELEDILEAYYYATLSQEERDYPCMDIDGDEDYSLDECEDLLPW